jgi:hypothetical protein
VTTYEPGRLCVCEHPYAVHDVADDEPGPCYQEPPGSACGCYAFLAAPLPTEPCDRDACDFPCEANGHGWFAREISTGVADVMILCPCEHHEVKA